VPAEIDPACVKTCTEQKSLESYRFHLILNCSKRADAGRSTHSALAALMFPPLRYGRGEMARDVDKHNPACLALHVRQRMRSGAARTLRTGASIWLHGASNRRLCHASGGSLALAFAAFTDLRDASGGAVAEAGSRPPLPSPTTTKGAQ